MDINNAPKIIFFPGNLSLARAYPAMVGNIRLPATTIAVEAKVFQYHLIMGYFVNSSLKLSNVHTLTGAHVCTYRYGSREL